MMTLRVDSLEIAVCSPVLAEHRGWSGCHGDMYAKHGLNEPIDNRTRQSTFDSKSDLVKWREAIEWMGWRGRRDCTP